MIKYLIIYIIVVFIISLFIFLFPLFKKLFGRRIFKRKVNRTIYQIALDSDFFMISEVALIIENMTVHFDNILFTDKYIYLIGNLYSERSLSGKYQDLQWLEYEKYNKKESRVNPFNKAKIRKDYLKSFYKGTDDLFVSILLVNDDCLLDKIEGCPPDYQIMNLKDFKNYVINNEKNNIENIDMRQLESLVNNIYKKNNRDKALLANKKS